MKKLSYLLIISLLAHLSAFSQENKLLEILKENDVAGIQLIYSKNNETQAYNLGTIKPGSQKKITTNTIFQVASLSKTVFAYAVLCLFDRGLLDLDEPILNYIGADFDRYDRKNPNYGKITARMVLRHTTGFPNWGDDKTAILQFPPDSCWGYSGEGYTFLQKGIEHKLKKTLQEIAQEEVFTPLKMENSSFIWLNKFDGLAAFVDKPRDKSRYARANAAYSLLTNTIDFNIFLQALMTGKGLKPETHQMMLEKASPANRFNRPVVEADAFIDWGLGLGLQTNEKGSAIWHWGDNGDAKCFYLAYPEQNESVVYFTHSFNGLNITEEIMKVFFGDEHICWASKWLAYGYENPVAMKTLQAELMKKGFSQVDEVVKQLKKEDEKFQLVENDLNTWGYNLLRVNKKAEAIEIFKLNVNLYPNSANTYDSLAEAYEMNKNKTLAIKNYKRSLELNPQNTNAVEHLKKLER